MVEIIDKGVKQSLELNQQVYQTMPYSRLAIIVIFSAIIATFIAPTKAQYMPSLMQGKPYEEERKKLIESGWQKVIDSTKNCKMAAYGSARNGFSEKTCFRYEEHDDCSANGFCRFIWRNSSGVRLKVTTLGYPYTVQNWDLE